MKKIFFLLFLNYLLFSVEIFFSSTKNEARLIFFDVGQGDAALLISPQGKTLLIDGGPDKKIVEKVNNYLPRRNKKIDWVILSHQHDDHYIGLMSLLDYYSFKRIIADLESEKKSIQYFLANLESRNVKIIELDRNIKQFSLEPGCYFSVLASPLLFLDTDKKVSINNSSNSVKINCFGLKALFTGDLEKDGENSLLNLNYFDFLSADIFKAGHHGSRTSNQLEFLEAVSPIWTVISAGKNNSYGHPNKEVLNNFEKMKTKIYRTDLNGDIKFLTNGKEIYLITEF